MSLSRNSKALGAFQESFRSLPYDYAPRRAIRRVWRFGDWCGLFVSVTLILGAILGLLD